MTSSSSVLNRLGQAFRLGGRQGDGATADAIPAGSNHLVIALASILLNVFAMALPLVLLQVYDRIIPNSSYGTLLLLIAGVATSVGLEAMLRVARSEIVNWNGARFEHIAGCRAFSRIMTTPSDELERVGAGELVERLSGLPMVREIVFEHWTLVICDLPFVFIFLAAIWYLAGWLVLAPGLTLLLFTLIIIQSSHATDKAIDEFNTVKNRRQNFNIEIIQGNHAIKSMAMEGQMIQRFARLQEAVAVAFHRLTLGNTLSTVISQFFVQMTTLSVVIFGGVMVVDNQLTVGGLSACTLLAGRALQPIQKVAMMWTRMQSAMTMRRRFLSIFSLPAPPAALAATAAEVEEVGEVEPLDRLEGGLSLDHVTFAYGDNPPLLQDVTLDIAPGQRIAIAGDNACGKSTLLRLLLGVLQPTSGEVRIDGRPIDSIDRPILDASLGYAPQRSMLFRGTLLENLTMFRPERIHDALEIAGQLGLDEVVYRLPQGYETRVCEGSGDGLPQGVVQRVGVARALVGKPRILLFDEANAFMDGAGDESLRRYLEGLDRSMTLVLITLRPSLQRLSDRVLMIKDGRLVDKPPMAAAPPPPPPPTALAPVAEPKAGAAE